MEKVGDAYSRALDEFTEALSNKGDMVEAWDNVGYVHLRLGAYQESIDDYNHALALKPDLMDAIEHRAEAYLAVDRIDDVKAPYMDLYNHDAGPGRPADDRHAEVAQPSIRPTPKACARPTSTRSASGSPSATASPSRPRRCRSTRLEAGRPPALSRPLRAPRSRGEAPPRRPRVAQRGEAMMPCPAVSAGCADGASPGSGADSTAPKNRCA